MANYEFNFEDGNEEYYSGVEVVDPALETKPEQTVQVVGLEETEGFIYVDLVDEENIVTDSESAFPAMGDSNDELRHSLLTGRDLYDQHPVSAITGLREELNLIRSLKTVYSDKRQVADYYRWNDTNYYEENRIGYFVTVCEDANSIKICDGTNVFGVTVDQAAFAGGQDDIERGSDYSLVVNNGIVHVRCETNVSVGDCVVSNRYGVAKKNEENYGFKVIGIEWINGVKFAIVMLNLSVDQIDAIGENINNFSSRLNDVEENLLSAINLANEAYNKSTNAIHNANAAIDTSNSVSGNFGNISLGVENSNQLAQQAIETAIQAQTIANSTITTAEALKQEVIEVAETLRQEAVEAANEALAETVKIKNDVTKTIEEIQSDVDGSKLEIESAFENLSELEEDLEELASWKSEDGTKTGIVGFVARADEDSSQLATLTKWKSEAAESIAGVVQTADDNKAAIDILAGFEYGNDYALYPYMDSVKDTEGNGTAATIGPRNGITFSDNGEGVITANGTASSNSDFTIAQNLVLSKGKYSMSGCPQNGSHETYCVIVKKYKEDNTYEYFEDIGLSQDIDTEEYSKIDCKFEIEDGDTISIWIRIASGTEVDNLQFNPCLKQYYMGISGLRNQVSKNGSSIDLLASFDSGMGQGVAGLIAQVSDQGATLNTLTSWQTEATNALSATQKKVNEECATKTEVAQLKTDTSTAISASISEASKDYAKQSDLTSFQNDTNTSLASIQREANADEASIRLLVANLEKHRVGAYSPAYGFNSTQAKEMLEDGVIYVPTVTHTENTYTSSAYSFTKGYYYVWVKSTGTWTASGKVVVSGTEPSGTTYPYWYTDSDTVTSGYELHTLYKLEIYTQDGASSTRWVAVASLKGDSSNRAISQIRQNANAISVQVTNAQGSITGLTTRMGTAESSLNTVVAWKNNVSSNVSKIATIESKANASAASISQVVSSVGSNGQVTSASIITAINNSGSSVTINASKINFVGFTTFVRPSDLSSSGTTTISGNRVRTGTIASNNYVYGQSGMSIDLSNGAIYCKNFSVNADGSVDVKGKITAYSGSIAGYTIGKSKAYPKLDTLHKVIPYDDGTQCEVGMKASDGPGDLAFYVTKSTNNWASDTGKIHMFYVKNNGSMYATAGQIGGWNIKDNYLDSYVGSTYKRLYLSSGSNTADSWIKATDVNNTTTFKITKEGVMHAKGAVINGTLSSVSGTFVKLSAGKSSFAKNQVIIDASYENAAGEEVAQGSVIIGVSGISGWEDITIRPSKNNIGNIGTPTRSWDILYVKNGAVQSSDRNFKTDISVMGEKQEKLFNLLSPVTFKFIDSSYDRYHYGFISQDVEEAIYKCGLTTKDFAGFCKDVKRDDNGELVFDENGNQEYVYSLRYNEFIALNTHMIQKLQSENKELKERVDSLENKLNKLLEE